MAQALSPGRQAAGGRHWLGPAHDLFRLLRDAFEVLWAEGATSPAMMSVGLHPRSSCHPARAAGVARFLDHVAARGGAWVCRRLDIADHWIRAHPAGP